MTKKPFLNFFPGHSYRYIDQTGEGRGPVATATVLPDFNTSGYEAYFTVNGFDGSPDAKKENCTSINSFFIDIDGRKDPSELEDIKKKLHPTFIIETKNGFHIYWLLDAPIFKNEVTEIEWGNAVLQWEGVEAKIVEELKADKVVKDLPRILRQPDTYYWKKSGAAFKNGVESALFIIKEIYRNEQARYSIKEVAEVFPPSGDTVMDVRTALVYGKNDKSYAEVERKDFFDRVNKEYSMASRPSFLALISGEKGTLPEKIASRNEALLVTASLMRQAGWNQKQALEHLKTVGWHGIEKEKRGWVEICNTVQSAYQKGYTYSYKNEIIAFNMTEDEQRSIQNAYAKVSKDRKEIDKVRYSNYEYEIFARFPNLKKNETGVIFEYQNGVYRMMTDQEVSNLILTCLYDDMMWNYRTGKAVSDKTACLVSIIPDLVLTENREILNVKNGLLNIHTLELKPHTPDFISLIQSPVNYDKEAICPTWYKCMESWMEGDEQEQKTKVLQQYCGYCLSSSTQQSAALFIIGDGGNGKSTFVDTISMVLGNEAVSHIALDELYTDFGFAGLIGKRLNVVEEVSGNYYESHKLKKLISGEEVTINMKYKAQFKFRPEAKFIFAVNAMPRVDDTSSATERRMLTVVFGNNFRINANVDLRFKDGILANELSGILNWMLEGVKKLKQDKKFLLTKEQVALLEEYRQDISSVEGFISECLEFVEGEMTSIRDLYDKYSIFCKKDGRKTKSHVVFSKEMKSYADRTKKISFLIRKNSKDFTKVEGVKINKYWDKVKSIYDNVNDVDF